MRRPRRCMYQIIACGGESRDLSLNNRDLYPSQELWSESGLLQHHGEKRAEGMADLRHGPTLFERSEKNAVRDLERVSIGDRE
jgi:hypothetical protein